MTPPHLPHVDLRDFRFFLAVAEELHFRRAAERLRVAQPHLSLHIKGLEERLGVALLERTTRSVRLTPAGELFLERVRYTIAQFDEAVGDVRRFSAGKSGLLSIGFTPAAGDHILPWILRAFTAHFPSVDIDLIHGGTEQQVRDLIDGRSHFGFLRLPVHTRRLNTLTLAREGVVAALPKGHRLTARAAIQLEDLADEPFILYSPGVGVDFQEQIVAYCNRAGFSPRLHYELGQTEAIIALVGAGLGVAVLPEWVKDSYRSHVVFKPLPEVPPLVDLALAWVDADLSPLKRGFLDVAALYVDAHPAS